MDNEDKEKSNLPVPESTSVESTEREMLIDQVVKKVVSDIFTDGFTIVQDEGVGPYAPGPEVFLIGHRLIGYIDKSGRKLQAELTSDRIRGAINSDSLILVIKDQQFPGVHPPPGQHVIRSLVVERENDWTEEFNRRVEELKNQRRLNISEVYEKAREGLEDADPIKTLRNSISVYELGPQVSTKEGSSKPLAIAEQLQFLRGILDATVDRPFTEELAKDREQWLGDVNWNRDNPNDKTIKRLL